MGSPLRGLLRAAWRQPATVLSAVALVAAAVGVATALFAYFGALWWGQTDAPRPGDLAAVYFGSAEEPRRSASGGELDLVLAAGPPLAQAVGFSPFGASLGDATETRFVWGHLVSGSYFDLFGAAPARGRLLQPGDDRPGAPPVAVLHHSFWRSRLGGDEAVVGREVVLNGVRLTVVGITPPGFQGHGLATAVYVPLAFADAVTGVARRHDPAARWLALVVRKERDAEWPEVAAAAAGLGRAADGEYPEEAPRQVAVVPVGSHDTAFGADPAVDSARALFAGAVLFLALAAASLANLLLARAAERRDEWTVRACLGASRWRLAAGVAAESALLCAAGGLLGLPIALLLAGHLGGYLQTSAVGMAGWGEWSEWVRLDGRALLFGALATSVCATGAAAAPVARLLRGLPLRPAAGRGATGVALRGRSALVAAQLALSVTLGLGGGLLARSLGHAAAWDPGFTTADLHLATVYVPRALARAGDAGLPERVRTEVASLPGVRAAALAHMAPLAGWQRETTAAPAAQPEAAVDCAYDLLTPGWFATLGVPLIAGRDFTPTDDAEAPAAAIVSQALARRLWGDAPAVGRRLVAPGSKRDSWEVVGVAADLPGAGPTLAAAPMVYFPVAQRPHARLTLVVRSPLPAEAVAASVRDALRRVDPGLSVVETVPGDAARRRLVLPQRLHAELATLFAALGLGVGVVGLFGLLSHLVAARRPELALRLVVGATPGDLMRLVFRQAGLLVASGCALGLAAWVPLSGVVRSLLVGVGPLDPWTLAAVPLLLAAVAALASAPPAWRAARLDPAAGLRGGS